MSALSNFHPSIRAWFSANFSEPTDVQGASWPVIASGQHVLATAPTGSGKTLTAFLWALNQFADNACEAGRTRVLYVSPLKALNNDIQRNLLVPLQQLRTDFDYPELSVKTRSGDTPQSDRQRMLRRPPDILITIPESLSLLLTTTKGRQDLSHIDTVILDEIHSIVGNRRGVQLMTSLERLVRLADEFQRIALSATVRPLDKVGQYVAGYTAAGRPRKMAIIESTTRKTIEFHVRFPEEARDAARKVLSHRPALDYDTNPELNDKPCPCCHSKAVISPKPVILMALRWYVAYALSYRDIEELMNERGVKVDMVQTQ
jgi:ATP-dependent Lhr-like helicase